MKIFYLTELLSPYRVEWMNMLGRENSVTAYYLYESEQTRDERWLSSTKAGFAAKKVERSRFSKKLPSRSFLREVLSGDYDIFIIDGYSSPIKLIAIRKLLKNGRKVYINIDGIDLWKPKSKADAVKDFIKKRVYRSGAYFLCGSRLAADAVIKGGAKSERVFTHPFTSLHDKDIIAPEQKAELCEKYKKKLNIENQKLVLAVGRFIPLKRYDCLIRAWRGMPDNCRLLIIGGGAERENYERIIRENGVKNIGLIDFLLPEQIAGYYCAADLFVHPSSTETWGLVINEAMAKGCPVIATNRCVGAVELIRDGAEGFITETGDAEALREKMLTVLENDALREKMAENAVKRIQPYTYENQAAVHLEIFESTRAKP